MIFSGQWMPSHSISDPALALPPYSPTHPLSTVYATGHWSPATVFSTYEPAREKRVRITQATSKGSGEPAYKHSLAKAYAIQRHVVEALR